MSRRLAGLAGLTTLLLVACGGGGGGGTTPPPSTRTLSGTISSLAGQVSDSDVKDANGPQVSNDDAATAQVIPNAVTVGGWAGPTDTLDWFKVSLSAGQSVTLTISDAAAEDLDLFLVRQDDPNTVVASSEQAPPAAVETVNVPATAAYYVVVQWLDSTALTPKGSSYLLTLGTGPASAPASLSVAREFVPGEVLVRFRPNQLALAAQGGLEARAAAMGLRVLDGAADREVLLSMGDGSAAGRAAALAALGAPADRAVGPWSRVTDAVTEAKLDTLAAIKALRRRADVATADPNYIFHPEAVPDDPAYQFQWHYPLINLPQAWEVSKGGATVGSSVVVAVVDTGVYLNHPDLAGKLVNGYDFISSPTVARDATGRDPDPDDPGDAAIAGQSSFHGTHVAGTIAAATGNGVGVAGVGWNTRVMPVRVLGAGGGTSADILAALRWLAGTGGATRRPRPCAPP